MPTRPIRFLQAGDFHLERPPWGLIDLPPPLHEQLLSAPYSAAAAVFDAALAHDVDFVILTGDLLVPHVAGPRGIAFLHEQFERLAAKDIPVYWCWGEAELVDPWLAEVNWPANIEVFSGAASEELHFQRPGLSPIRVIGAARSSSGRVEPALLLGEPGPAITVVLTYGHAEAATLMQSPIHFWALGGEHARRTLFTSPGAAHYSGTPQGRDAVEAGGHGYSLVTLDDQGRARIQAVDCDVARWCHESIDVLPQTQPDELEKLIRDRIRTRTLESPSSAVLIDFEFTGATTLAAGVRYDAIVAKLLTELRDHYSHQTPPVWTLSIDTPIVVPSADDEGDTILGDFLRLVRHYAVAPNSPMQLATYLPEHAAAEALAAALAIDEPTRREAVLREVAILGGDLLRGEEAA